MEKCFKLHPEDFTWTCTEDYLLVFYSFTSILCCLETSLVGWKRGIAIKSWMSRQTYTSMFYLKVQVQEIYGLQ